MAASPAATTAATLLKAKTDAKTNDKGENSAPIISRISSTRSVDENEVVLVTTGTCNCVGTFGSPVSQETVVVPSVSVTPIVSLPPGAVMSAVTVTVLGGLVDTVSVLTVTSYLAAAAAVLETAALSRVCSVVVGSQTAARPYAWGAGGVAAKHNAACAWDSVGSGKPAAGDAGTAPNG